MRALAPLVLAGVVAAGAAGAGAQWDTRAPMPLPRTEVVAATVGSEIVVLGGLTLQRDASRRVDAYSPARDSWRRLPNLPLGVHHAMAAGAGGRLYVLGGYTIDGTPQRTVFSLERGRWRSLPRMPFPRAAAGAGVAEARIVVAGGVGAGGRLARNALSFDLRTRRWSIVPGPTPREHLGVTALGGVVYAVGGRTAGYDTNLLHFESYRPGDTGWRRLAPVPDARGGTGAAALGGVVVSAGGEEPAGAIAEVLAYRVAERRWVQLPDLETPRHGVGMAALDGRVFVIGGGPEPGLTVSSANESLAVARSSWRRSSADQVTASTLAFRRADGSRIRFPGRVRAWCGAWDESHAARTLHVAVLKADGSGYARPFWLVQAVLQDVARGRVIRFPVGFTDLDVRGGIVFVYDRKTRNEVSSEDEAAKGRMSFAPVGCDLGAPVRFTVTGTLGSEFFQGKPVQVSGTFRGTIGRRPAWAPR